MFNGLLYKLTIFQLKIKDSFGSIILNKLSIYFFIDKSYLPDYIPPVFSSLSYKAGDRWPRPFFWFFTERGWFNWFVQPLKMVSSALLWLQRGVPTMAGFATRSWSNAMAAIGPLSFLPNGTAQLVLILRWNGKPVIATLHRMLSRLLLPQKRRLIRSRPPKEVKGNIAYDLQVNPAHCRAGFFYQLPFPIRIAGLFPVPPDFYKFFSLDNFPSKTV